MQYIQTQYLERYNKLQTYTLHKHFNKLATAKQSSGLPFSFYIKSSSVYSSLIEGSNIDEATFMQYQDAGITGNKDFAQVQDLIKAYEYAQTHKLTLANFLHTHQLLSHNLVQKKYQGKYRDKEVEVYKGFIKIYEACPAKNVNEEMQKLFADVQNLITKQLTYNEIFYYAAMLHLCLAHIHPFADGNGRAARLIEKWFLAQMLGKTAWLLQSEKMYYKQRPQYYKTINLGNSYATLNYGKCLDFLLMLPMALRTK